MIEKQRNAKGICLSNASQLYWVWKKEVSMKDKVQHILVLFLGSPVICIW